MHHLSLRLSKKKKTSHIIERIGSILFFSLFLLHCLHIPSSNAIEKDPLSKQDDQLKDIVNPFKSTCYDWRGKAIPCDFKRQYAELLFDKPIPDPRFMDNKNGTVTDKLTGLIWLKNTKCFKMMDWKGAILAAKNLKEGDCGPDSGLILSDGSSAGDWRLPTMHELCVLIDYSKRNPALPDSYIFPDFPSGYYWSATTLDHHPGLVWIVYMESGTTCYEGIKNHAGHSWPVRGPKE